MSNIEMIRAAADRLNGHARVTPLLSSPFIDQIAGRKVLVKAECLQHTGSFKFRGGWSALSMFNQEQKARGVVAYSSGNHAQGVANAARAFGAPAVIVMPSDAPSSKIENTRAMGAEVVLYDRGSKDRDLLGQKIQQQRQMKLVKPFDEPLVIAGQGTIGLEIVAQIKTEGFDKAEVLVPCGGGGLTSGIALALEAKAPKMKVRPVEPEEFDDVARSLISGKREVNLRKSGSLADAVLTPSPGEITFPILKRLCGPGIVVSEQECLRAMALAFNHLKIVIEPGGAVALAAALFRGEQLSDGPVITVATGGNVDARVFQHALEKYGE